MKRVLAIAVAIILSGCSTIGFGGWVAAHQSAIVATGLVAGTVSQVESATLNGVALGKEVKAAVQPSAK